MTASIHPIRPVQRANRRGIRNVLARALMEGYGFSYEQLRFALLTADLCLDTLRAHGWAPSESDEDLD